MEHMALKLQKTLKILMAKNGLNVPRLASLVKISRQTLSNWSEGQSPRNIEQVRTVAKFFNVSLEYLLFEEEPPKRNPIEEYQDEINAGTFDVILRRNRK